MPRLRISKLLFISLLLTFLSGCGRSWPAAGVGVHAGARLPTRAPEPKAVEPTLAFQTQISLGSVFPSELSWVGPGFVYANLRTLPGGKLSGGFFVYDPEREYILWRKDGGNYSMTELQVATDEFLVVRQYPQGKTTSELNSYNIETGKQATSYTLPAGAEVLGVINKGKTVLVWNKEVKQIRSYGTSSKEFDWIIPTAGKNVPQIVQHGVNVVAMTSQGATCFNASGTIIWKSNTPLHAPLVFAERGRELTWVTASKQLQTIDLTNGKTKKTSKPLNSKPEWTNLTYAGNRWILRGLAKNGKYVRVQMVHAFDSGLEDLWLHKSLLAITTSNVVAHGNTLYMANAQNGIALNAQTGERLALISISESGKGYPTVVHKMNSTIVFEGELVVLGIKPEDNTVLWRRSANPLMGQLDVQSLQSTTDRIKSNLGVEDIDFMAGSQSFSFQASQLQRQANSLSALADKAKAFGKGYKSLRLSTQSQISSAFGKAFANGSLALSGIGSALEQEQAQWRQSWQQDLGFRILALQAIIDHAQNTYSGKYTYRPASTKTGGGIKIFNMATGQHKMVKTGNQHGLGLLKLVDCKRNLLIHFGTMAASNSTQQFIDARLRVGHLVCE